eukprot:scaffold127746_cov69-Phaeocystis_antarctica.AAC.1
MTLRRSTCASHGPASGSQAASHRLAYTPSRCNASDIADPPYITPVAVSTSKNASATRHHLYVVGPPA